MSKIEALHDKYIVVAVPVGKTPYKSDMSVDDIYNFVEDCVQPIHLYDNIYALIDEDGETKNNYQLNRTIVIQNQTILSLSLVNNFVLISFDSKEEKIKDMTDKEISEVILIFHETNPDCIMYI